MNFRRKDVFSTVTKWEQFYKDIQQDLKLYLFLLILFTLYRIGFITVLNNNLSDMTTLKDIAIALFYGLRISLKSAGMAALISFGFCTVLNLFVKNKELHKVRLEIGYICIGILTFLFYARIPYYEQFHMAFNQFLFNTFNDDVQALLMTLVQQYKLLPRLVMVAVTTIIMCRVLKLWLKTKTYSLPKFSSRYKDIAFRSVLICILAIFPTFNRFGGSLTYAYDVSWENAGVTKDDLLNEAILDDVQALYRAYTLHERLSASTGLDIDVEKMADYGARLSGRKISTDNVETYFEKRAQGAKVQKPKHIFLIVAESYANWPLLPQYSDLNIANGLKSIIAQQDAAYVPAFLPNGMGTAAGVNGIVSGLPDVNLYLNYHQETYKSVYATALAPQLKRLGYKTEFWYGGPESWERVKDFVTAQGFDEFHAYGDFDSRSGNVWGSDDKYLLTAVARSVKEDVPTLHVILTVSNHAPYTVNLAEEGFDSNKIVAGLPDKYKNDQDLVTKLGHFWYADKMLANFVKDMHQNYPDSLFIITGDHADRLNIEASPNLYERYAIPFVVYGNGISKHVFSEKAAGSHINITSTLIELIAPKDFTYYSVGASLTRNNSLGFNYGFWITSDYIGKVGAETGDKLPSAVDAVLLPDLGYVQQEVDAARAVSWWRVKNGKYLN